MIGLATRLNRGAGGPGEIGDIRGRANADDGGRVRQVLPDDVAAIVKLAKDVTLVPN